MKILFATDGSVNADIALQTFLENQWPEGAICKVVTVSEPLHQRLNAAMFGIGDLARKAQADLEADLRELLAECLVKLEAKFGKGNVTTELLEGDAKVEVNRVAQAWGSDLIVIGAHGSDVDDSWTGSVTRAVLLSAPCSVRVLNTGSSWAQAKPGTDTAPDLISRYLVAVSDEANAKAIVDSILARPWASGSHFQLISVVHRHDALSKSRFFQSKNIQELHAQSFDGQMKAAEVFLKAQAARLESKFPADHITYHGLEGSPRSLILQIAQDWPADMVIIGSHDHDHGIVEHFLGSTAAAVVWNAGCSVELVKLAKVAVTN